MRRLLSVCLSVRLYQNTRKKSLEKNRVKRSKVKRVKVKGHKRSRSKSKVKVTINVKEKAGGLTPTSSCFISSCQVLVQF